MNDFLSKIAEILEVESVTQETRFREVGEFDSLKGFTIIVLMESDYDKQMSVEAFLACNTVAELAAFAGLQV